MKILVSFLVLFFACSTSESIVEKAPSSDISTSINKETNDIDEIQRSKKILLVKLDDYPYLSIYRILILIV